MKTVPTLCATGTCVAASALGLAFGREEALDASRKKKATPGRLEQRAMPAAVQTTSSVTNTQAFSSPIPFSSSRVPVTTRLSHDGRPQRRLVRRMTSGDPLQRSYDTMLNDFANAGSDRSLDDRDLTPNPDLPRRASWIKRLSTISTSHQSSRNSSPGPLSPSVSCSNGSMAFSHDGSTAPMIGKRSASPLPPNKLVKRSSSVHVSRASLSQPSGSRLPSLRRPATSHQRSATLQHSAFMEMTLEQPSLDDLQRSSNTDTEVQYAQFFSPKLAKERTLSKRRSPGSNSKGLKRIFPDDGHKPTLLLAKSVAAGTDEEIDDSSSIDGAESVFFLSRPGTPMSITAVISAKADGPNSGESKRPRGRSSMDVNDEAARPRRSFSITDLLSSGSSTKKQRTSKLPGTGLLSRNSSQRVSSAPLPTMGRRPSSTAHGDSATSARRDLTDPAIARRQISTSAGPIERANVRASANHNQVPPSPTLVHPGGRPSRHSVAPSEQASTLVGSDNEARGGDEDDTDLQSETVFDSLRTGATRSTSGARGPRIETIFDESPPSKIKVTALRDLLPKGTFREQTIDGARGHQSIIAEEEESISTPVRTIVPERSVNDSPSLNRGHGPPLFPTLIPSSPPDMPKPLSLGTLEYDSRAEDDDDDSRWSINEQEEDDTWNDLPARPPATHIATPVSLGRHNPRLVANGSSPKPITPPPPSTIFDWSEQQITDKSSGNRTPPRPRTVHGKKDADRRGSRSVGRRAPSGLHARSQSVPVVPDATGKRSTIVTNKFGTWGVGSKGVTEDWNDDFDFSDLHEEPVEGTAGTQRIDSGTAMVVPKNIQDQQSNVLANIGLLREWGLLIEELKEQRIRATALGLLAGPNAGTSGMWEEVDAMIDLADQEVEQDGIPRLSPPSSPGFDNEDAFDVDDVSDPSPNHGRGRPKANELASTQPSRARRKSILPPNYEIFGPQSSPLPSNKHGTPLTPDTKSISTRPRKDSEAKARSVIEALQKRKSTHESSFSEPPTTKKVPFDTATLRRIVPYVSTLTRKVKEALREAEGLYSSPSTSPKEPPFSKIFVSDNDLATQMNLMTVM
ncbi:hypothetical protein BDV96DRAFT_279380 [Lophiotrema nucula]|uniref:Uncharacterized protein n=1 Tax=Lophiotrema nucula TaxID=690887 RepID=A0A6A5ZRK4_9PLEO|nr:hypothetical protein BDV96DRAFT_279380 [Lophiotrema nucula]